MIPSAATLHLSQPVISAYLISTDQFHALESVNWLGWLDHQDKTRVDHASNKRRREFLLSRFLLRYALSAQTRMDPAGIRFTERSGSTPRISNPGHADLAHSLSHSRKQVLVAVSSEPLSAIGVDIEFCGTDRNFGRTISGFCSSAEQAEFSALSSQAARVNWFYHAWTAKEAVFKASDQHLSSTTTPTVVASGRYRQYWISVAASRQSALCLAEARLCAGAGKLELQPVALAPR